MNISRINIHAGHAKQGNKYSGASKYLNESTEARLVVNKANEILRANGIVVKNCTVDCGKSQKHILEQIMSLCSFTADLDVSVHFNSSALPTANGVEVCVYGKKSKALPYAQAVLKNIASLGFKNRGIKYRPDLYVLRESPRPAMLIECCFVSSKKDYALYDAEKMAKAIANGILGMAQKAPQTTPAQKPQYFYFEGLEYSPVFDADFYYNKYEDLQRFVGKSPELLFNHFKTHGMAESRVASSEFDVNIYYGKYADLREEYEENYPEYYKHYLAFGKKEGRTAK